MTDLIDQPTSQFVGKVYTTESSDQMGTFYPAWQEFEADGYFKQLDQLCSQPNRSYLVVFSPYGNFQYWIGSVTPVGVAAPAGLEAVPLPAGTVGKTSGPVNGLLNQLPVQTAVGKGFEMLEKAGFTIPAHIGQTDHPYYLESYPVTDGKVSQVQYLLYINPDQLGGYDEFD
ncbi:hypothetical protein ACFQ3L_09070 [Lacticaseibacillus jixianensis]|uniref:GyrI-like domain-containing protein n=1 Tax=Lacticaseibacillus jixianensis TaxID=2486012 RepID=A0ABW4BAB0_9LACO|nr:GyrI-like domain-containing protein [Lacticaseibacillus jixianensis]